MCRHQARAASAKATSGPGTSSGAAAIWRRSTSRTIATHRPSLEPKWWMSIRWLVPSALGEPAQRQVGQPVGGDVVDRGVEQPLVVDHREASEKDCTNWYVMVYHPVHAQARTPSPSRSPSLATGSTSTST